jgi:hypothetical protein
MIRMFSIMSDLLCEMDGWFQRSSVPCRDFELSWDARRHTLHNLEVGLLPQASSPSRERASRVLISVTASLCRYNSVKRDRLPIAKCPLIWIYNNIKVNDLKYHFTSLSLMQFTCLDDGQNLPMMMVIRCCTKDVPPRPLTHIPPSALSRRRCNGCGGETEPDD